MAEEKAFEDRRKDKTPPPNGIDRRSKGSFGNKPWWLETSYVKEDIKPETRQTA